MNRKDAKVFYFPLDRGPRVAPEVTLIVGRLSDGYKVAWAFCSKNDCFEKRKGRTIALNRFDNQWGYICSTLTEVIDKVYTRMENLNKQRPDTISAATFTDLDKLPEIFNKIKNK